MGKVRLVGESNPYGADPYYALYPAPHGCSGQRLCELVLGMYRADYLEAFERYNLCAGKYSIKAAREEATILLNAAWKDEVKYVLCGQKVTLAFGVPFTPLAVHEARHPLLKHPARLLVLPHPSGLCRLWNAEMFAKARAAVAAFAPEVAPLLGKVRGARTEEVTDAR